MNANGERCRDWSCLALSLIQRLSPILERGQQPTGLDGLPFLSLHGQSRRPGQVPVRTAPVY